MRSPVSPLSSANSALIVALHNDTMLFVAASGPNGARLGFGLPQGPANSGEDIVGCARRILLEQLDVKVSFDALRYIGSAALEVNGQIYWQPIVVAKLPDTAQLESGSLLACPLTSLDALLASGGVAHAASLAALAFFGAKKRVGLLA